MAMSEAAREIVNAVACEVVARTASTLPPPCDLEAERLLVAGLLAGFESEGVPLKRGHFYQPLLGAVYELARLLRAEAMQPAIEPILVALREQGWQGAIERELLRLRDEVPAVSQSALTEAAGRVVELSKRRALIALCETVGAELRAGATDAGAARDRLAGGYHAA
jgi:replicative DNA helicase